MPQLVMEGTSSRKCQKLSGSSIDRISTLPDDVIYSILSLLPTKNSIATSVLSKRWRYMWAHVPNIDLDSAHNGGLNLDGASFSDIIYRVMLMYKVQNMNHFRLSYKHPCGEYQLETCIATAIVRNVKHLHLDLRDQVKLPLCIFTYKTLVDLRLCSCGSIPAAASTVYLPALKNLLLDRVRYECDKSLAHLLSGCPLLRELYIVRRAVDPLVCCSISSQTLVKLALKTCFVNDGSYTGTYSVKIDAPALRCLVLWDSVSNELSCGPLTSLLAGDVRLTIGVPVVSSRSALDLVGRLTNVKDLKITTRWLEVPQTAFLSSTMKFRNLTRLVINAGCPFLANFLTYADNLEHLKIATHLENDNLSCGLLPSPVPTCLSSRLKKVRIGVFKCIPNEYEYTMIAYFLRNAKVLKMMDIYFRLPDGADMKAKYDALNHISSFQRGSEACQVAFH